MGLITCTPYFIQLGNGYFMRTMSGSLSVYGQGVAEDSQGNIITVGYSQNILLFSNNIVVTKSTAAGVTIWQRAIGDGFASTHDLPRGMFIDASDNIYIGGFTSQSDTTTTVRDQLIIKYDSAGTVKWQRSLSGTAHDYAFGITGNDSGDTVSVGRTRDANNVDVGTITKRDSDGAILWQRQLGKSGGSTSLSDAVLGSSGEVYVGGYTSAEGNGNGNDMIIAKYSTLGVLAWKRAIGGNTTEILNGIAIDSLDNVYLVGYSASVANTTNKFYIVKYNSSGVRQWERALAELTDSTHSYAYDMIIDSSDDILIIGKIQDPVTFVWSMALVKLDSDGALVFQRKITAEYLSGDRINVTANGDILISGNGTLTSNDTTAEILLKLPSDGSLMGTYGDLIYGVGNLTLTSVTLTEAASTLVDAIGTMTNTNTTLPTTPVVENPTTVIGNYSSMKNINPNVNTRCTVDSSNNMYIIGYNSSEKEGDTHADVGLMKVDANLDFVWGKVIGKAGGYDWGRSTAVDSSNNVIVVGNTETDGQGSYDGFVVKFSPTGGEMWQRVLGGLGSDSLVAAAVDSLSNVYAAGFSNTLSEPSGAGGTELLIVKYNSVGTIQWKKILGATGTERAYDITIDSANNIYVSGYTTEGPGSQSALLVKYNTSGGVVWARTFGGSSAETGYSVITDANDDIYMTGRTNSIGQGGYDAFIVKYDTNGTVLWKRILGSSATENGYTVSVDPNGNVFICGDHVLAKFTSTGTLVWQKAFIDIISIYITSTDIVAVTNTKTILKMDLNASILSSSGLTIVEGTLASASVTLTQNSSSTTNSIGSLVSKTTTTMSTVNVDLKIGLDTTTIEIV